MILNAFNDDVRLFVFKWSKHMVNCNGEESVNFETEYAGDEINKLNNTLSFGTITASIGMLLTSFLSM